MALRVLKVVNRETAQKVLEEDWVKRTGASLRENLGGKNGLFLVINASDEVIKKLLDTGAFEVPENEEDLVEAAKKEEENAAAGVGLLGI